MNSIRNNYSEILYNVAKSKWCLQQHPKTRHRAPPLTNVVIFCVALFTKKVDKPIYETAKSKASEGVWRPQTVLLPRESEKVTRQKMYTHVCTWQKYHIVLTKSIQFVVGFVGVVDDTARFQAATIAIFETAYYTKLWTTKYTHFVGFSQLHKHRALNGQVGRENGRRRTSKY